MQNNFSYWTQKLEQIQQVNSSETISHLIRTTAQFTPEDALRQIKLSQIQPIREKDKQNEQSQPTFREINQMIELLQQRMPDKNIFSILQMLYNNLIFTNNSQNNQYKQLRGWEDLMQAKNIQIPQIASKQFIIRPLIRQKKFLKVGDQTKYLQRQIVAKSFVQRQYGLNHLEAEIMQSKSLIVIKRQRYTDLAYAAVTQGYRSLEHFLINQCKRTIKPSDKFQMGALHRVLCNCRILLKSQDSLTFLKFVRIAYNLHSVSVTEEAAVRLYISLQKEIRSRIGNRQLDRSINKRKWTKYLNMKRRREFDHEQFAKFLTNSIQREIVKEYLKTKLISKVKSYLIQKYPNNYKLFTLQSVRGVICKIVRLTIKRVFYYCEKCKDENLPTLLPIDSAYRCKISKGPQSMNIRISLLKLWLANQSKAFKKLPFVINQINNFINLQESLKGNFVVAQCSPNENVAQKIDFNINVSRSKLRQGFRVNSQSQVILKGTQSNFEHYLNIENGKNLHYYRKIKVNQEDMVQNANDIKIQDIDDGSDFEEQSDQLRKDEQIGNKLNYIQSQQKFNADIEVSTQVIIKQWIEKLNLDFFKKLL